MNIQIGKLNQKVIELLNLEYESEIPIILGDSNIEHMKRQQPNDYEKYGKDISLCSIKNQSKRSKYANKSKLRSISIRKRPW